ncbi:MAG: ABC transporter substrate-binding protein [Thermomicrobiales bacterium]
MTLQAEWAKSNQDLLDANAQKLAGNGDVEVIVAAGGPQAALAAQKYASKKKIVFTTVVDPVELGLVDSLQAPRKMNLTGMAGKTSELDVARLSTLHELLPNAHTIGVFIRQGRPLADHHWKLLKDSAPHGVKLQPYEFPSATFQDALNATAAAIKADPVDAILVTADSMFNDFRQGLVDFLNDTLVHLPAIYQWREFADVGGLISYGPSLREAYMQAGVYAGRVLSGTPPSDIPVAQPTRKELVINMRTAAALGVPVSQHLQDAATLIWTPPKPL